jgi:hypothetical protein
VSLYTWLTADVLSHYWLVGIVSMCAVLALKAGWVAWQRRRVVMAGVQIALAGLGIFSALGTYTTQYPPISYVDLVLGGCLIVLFATLGFEGDRKGDGFGQL